MNRQDVDMFIAHYERTTERRYIIKHDKVRDKMRRSSLEYYDTKQLLKDRDQMKISPGNMFYIRDIITCKRNYL